MEYHVFYSSGSNTENQAHTLRHIHKFDVSYFDWTLKYDVRDTRHRDRKVNNCHNSTHVFINQAQSQAYMTQDKGNCALKYKTILIGNTHHSKTIIYHIYHTAMVSGQTNGVWRLRRN